MSDTHPMRDGTLRIFRSSPLYIGAGGGKGCAYSVEKVVVMMAKTWRYGRRRQSYTTLDENDKKNVMFQKTLYVLERRMDY